MSCTRTQHDASRETQTNDPLISSRALYHWLALQILYSYTHVCDVPVSCKANGDRNQLWAWLDSDPKKQLITTVFESVIHVSLFVRLVQ